MRVLFAATVALYACAGTCAGQGFGNDCTPAGTWYGGAQTAAKYLLQATPDRAGDFATTFHQGFTPPNPPLARLTPFEGRMVYRGANRYDTYGIALGNRTTIPPPAGGEAADLYAVRGQAELLDCDTLQFVITFFARYDGGENWGKKVPFVDDPDFHMLPPPNTITEVYRRMPTPEQ